MGVIFDSTEIIALERNRGTVGQLVAGREDEPFGIRREEPWAGSSTRVGTMRRAMTSVTLRIPEHFLARPHTLVR